MIFISDKLDDIFTPFVLFLPIFTYFILFLIYIIMNSPKNYKKECIKSFSCYFLLFLVMHGLSDFLQKIGVILFYTELVYYLPGNGDRFLPILFILSFPISMASYIVLFSGMELALFNKKTKFIFSKILTIFCLFILIFTVLSAFIENLWPFSTRRFYFILPFTQIIFGLNAIVLLFIFWRKKPNFRIFIIYLILGIFVLFIISPGIELTFRIFTYLNDYVYLVHNIDDPRYNFALILFHLSHIFRPFGVLLLTIGSILTRLVPLNSPNIIIENEQIQVEKK